MMQKLNDNACNLTYLSNIDEVSTARSCDHLEMEALLEMGCKFQVLSVMFCIIFICKQKCVYKFKAAQLFI